MFQFRRQRKDSSGGSVAAVPIEAPSAPEEKAGADQTDLLQRWMSLAAMQQRVINSLVAEIQQTSTFVETETNVLSERFQRLAANAEQQTERVDSLTNLAIGIEVDGESVPIEGIASLLERTLSDVVEKILMLSKDSMSMVYALDSLNQNVVSVGKCMEQLRGINATTNMLALNARIEAERAGPAGAAFRVVANEVRELSGATQALAGSMQGELKNVMDGIASGHDTLQRVATIDMSENILAKDRLGVLLSALVRRSESLTTVVSDAVREAEQISGDVGGMVTGIQFQDRTRQRLEHVVDTLHVVDQAIEELRSSTRERVPEADVGLGDDVEWVKALLARFTMSEMRAKFVAQVLDGTPGDSAIEASVSSVSETGTIELF